MVSKKKEDVKSFIKEWENKKDWNEAYAYINALIKKEEFGLIYEIADEISKISTSSISLDAIYDTILKELSHCPNKTALNTLIKLPIGKSLSDVAGRIVVFQNLDDICKLFDNPKEDLFELLDLISQEMILRSRKLDAKIKNYIKSRGNDYSKLPLSLLNVEKSLPLIQFGITRGHSCALPSIENHKHNQITKRQSIEIFFKIGKNKKEDEILYAFQPWLNESNGKFIMKEIIFKDSLSVMDLSIFNKINLSCFSGDLKVYQSNPKEIFKNLFSASHGGAYSRSQGDAKSRLSAWKSLSGFLNHTLNDGCEAIEKSANLCEWYVFESDWFYNIAWDIGIVQLSQDKKKMLILAVTDKD